jgi:hypothetical protein
MFESKLHWGLLVNAGGVCIVVALIGGSDWHAVISEMNFEKLYICIISYTYIF